jgi:hypothetical protein
MTISGNITNTNITMVKISLSIIKTESYRTIETTLYINALIFGRKIPVSGVKRVLSPNLIIRAYVLRIQLLNNYGD